MATFCNLTPLTINIVRPDGGTLDIAPSGTIARVAEEVTPMGEMGGVPLVSKKFGDVVNLPPPDGRIFVVSALVAQAVWRSGRHNDVVCPGNPVRDSEGRIIGCEALCVSPDIRL